MNGLEATRQRPVKTGKDQQTNLSCAFQAINNELAHLTAFVLSILAEPHGRRYSERAQLPLRRIIELWRQVICTTTQRSCDFGLEINQGECREGRQSD
jgi:hypothetical protein